MECTGDPFPSPAPRSDLCNRHSRARPQLVSPIPTARDAFARGAACPGSPGDALTEDRAEPADAARAPADVDQLHKLVLQSLDDDQAQEVVSIPLAGKSNIA